MKVNWVEAVWVNSPLRTVMQQREIACFRRAARIAPGGRVLEIGCGRGKGAQLVLRAFAPARVDAIDIDPAMIRLAERRKKRLGLREVELLVADAQELPFPDSSMDAVFNFGIIHHLEDWRRGVREIARVLKPGAAFCFEEIYPALYANRFWRHLLAHPREDRFSGPQFRGALQAAGLRLVPGYRETPNRIVAVALKADGAGRP
jgi:ubiquinone/menaquinone biosynthesis C-methylase UbiE